MLIRLLALSLLVTLPAAAQAVDKGAAAPVSEAGELAGKDPTGEKVEELRQRAQKLEESGKKNAAAAMRRRAERLERTEKARGKPGDRRPHKKDEPEKDGKKPAGGEKKG